MTDSPTPVAGAPQPSPPADDGWLWMTHPSFRDGKPIPVWTFWERGRRYYIPFDDTGTDFEWDHRDNEWKVAAAPSAGTPPPAGMRDAAPPEPKVVAWFNPSNPNAIINAAQYPHVLPKNKVGYLPCIVAVRDAAPTPPSPDQPKED